MTVVLCVVGAPALGTAAAQDADAREGEKVGREADAELRRRASGGWSGAAIIEYRGRIVLKNGYGMADRERGVPFTTATVAQVGSITKQFTATAVLDLARQGRLRLTDSLTRYLPEARGAGRSITLHELLTHTSGLPQNCGRDFDRTTAEELVSGCLNSAPLATRGSYSYSNPGYSLLGIFVERVSGSTLENYLQDHFFGPLGLQIGYRFARAPGGGMAVCYASGTAQRPIADRIADLEGAFWHLKGNGGMQSSAEDMYRWYKALSEPAAALRELRDQLIAPRVPHSQPGVSYGYGWNARVDSLERVVQVSHSGSDGVCSAAFIWRPRDAAFVYIVGNSDAAATSQAASALLRIVRDRPAR